jgi:hypothetical protein
MMRSDIKIIEGDLVGGENSQQAIDNIRSEQHGALTVARIPQGAHGLEKLLQAHANPPPLQPSI